MIMRKFAFSSSSVIRALRPLLRWKLPWSLYVLNRRLGPLFSAVYYGVTYENRTTHADVFNLRRCVHQLEKGLSHPQRRAHFGELYVAEAVDTVVSASAKATVDRRTLSWAIAVLNRYFELCAPSPAVTGAQQRFLAARLNNVTPAHVPYRAAERPPLKVNYEDLLALARRRRSIRKFSPSPVSVESVQKAVAIAALAPSSCNRQPFHYLLYTDHAKIADIVSVTGGARGHFFPALIVVVGKYSGYFDEKEIFCPVIDSMQATMALQFALETLSLSSVCINWPNRTRSYQRIQKIVPLRCDEVIVMLLAVGVADPDGFIPYSEKRPVDDLLLVDPKSF